MTDMTKGAPAMPANLPDPRPGLEAQTARGATPAHPMSGGVDPGRVWYLPIEKPPEGWMHDISVYGKVGHDWKTVQILGAPTPLPAPAPPPGCVWLEIEDPPKNVSARFVQLYSRGDVYCDTVAPLAVHRAAPDAAKGAVLTGALTPHGERLAALRDAVVEAALAYRSQYSRGSSAKEWGVLNEAIDALRAAMTPPKDPVKELREALMNLGRVHGIGSEDDDFRRMDAAIAAIAGRDGE